MCAGGPGGSRIPLRVEYVRNQPKVLPRSMIASLWPVKVDHNLERTDPVHWKDYFQNGLFYSYFKISSLPIKERVTVETDFSVRPGRIKCGAYTTWIHFLSFKE